MANDFKSDNQNIYSTLFSKFSSAAQLNGVSTLFGEENIYGLNFPLPMVVMFPTADNVEDGQAAYVKNLDPNYKIIWLRKENFKFVLWAESNNPQASPQEDADQINVLIGKVFSAFYSIRATGYTFHPKAGSWQLFADAKTRRGRAYVLNVNVEIPVLYTTPQEATVTSVPVTEEIEDL